MIKGNTCFLKVKFSPPQVLLHSTLTKETSDSSSLLPWGRSGPVTLRKHRSVYIHKAWSQYPNNSYHYLLLFLPLLQTSWINSMELKTSQHQNSMLIKTTSAKYDEEQLTYQTALWPFVNLCNDPAILQHLVKWILGDLSCICVCVCSSHLLYEPIPRLQVS